MKNLLLTLVLVVIVASGLAIDASAQSNGAVLIERADRDRTQAMIKADLNMIDKTTADTYLFTDPTGRVTAKKELMDGFRNGSIRILSQDISDVKVQMYGDTAVETGKLTSKATRDGRDTSGTFRFTRVWVKRNGTWQSVAFQETKME